MLATCPFSTPVVVPPMAAPAVASARLIVLSPAIGVIWIAGAVSSTRRLRVAGAAGLPAASATLAVSV